MSSLRLALKKSLEEIPASAGSSKALAFDSYYDINELKKISRPKKRRATSIDEDNSSLSQNKKVSIQNDEVSISPVQGNIL